MAWYEINGPSSSPKNSSVEIHAYCDDELVTQIEVSFRGCDMYTSEVKSGNNVYVTAQTKSVEGMVEVTADFQNSGGYSASKKSCRFSVD